VSDSSVPAPEKTCPTIGEDLTSRTPRWMSMDGSTLSEKTGSLSVVGMGKGGGFFDPNRITIDSTRNRAFLKQ